MDIHFQGIWRMDWGFGNPNKTAAFIALLMIAIWALPLIRRWLFWVALPIFTALGVCLMHTMSRGGFVAAFVGLGAVLWKLPRPWPRLHVRAVAVAVTIMLGGAVALQTTARFAQSYQDRSITNRIEIWKRAPQMIVDAPAGWGLGNAGNAYASWYQPISDGEEYRTLVNSHLTWLVEFGWPLRILYVFGWFAVFVVCYGGAAQSKAGYGIAFGLWLTFFVASAFSSVAEVPWLWGAPVIGLAAVLTTRFRNRIWPTRLAWVCGMGAALAILGTLYGIGSTGPARNLSVSNSGSICVGTRSPKLWVLVSPPFAFNTISANYPRNLREYCKDTANLPAIGFADSLAGLPNLTGCKLAVIGALPKEEWHALRDRVQSCEELLLIAPDVLPDELNLPSNILAKTSVAFGEFSSRPYISSWQSAGKHQQIEGVGDFFQCWPEIVFTSLK
jgi:hypothetical protein